MTNTAQFYDALADDYQFIFADWQQSVRRQGVILGALIQSLATPIHTIWDCTCGIGTQALGLAEQGYSVHGTDLSPIAIERAREYMAHFDAAIAPIFAVCDLLTPSPVAAQYDLVLSCDNSIAHFLDDADLSRGLDSMIAAIRPGGYLLISLRDYDWIAQVRPQSTMPSVADAEDTRVIIFQVWDWEADGSAYDMTMFIVRQKGETLETRSHQTRLRALQRATLEAQLRAKGMLDIRWHMPDTSGYYQPIVTARRPS